MSISAQALLVSRHQPFHQRPDQFATALVATPLVSLEPARLKNLDASMLELEDVRKFLSSETGLATISTVQNDGRVLSSIANCGIISHPLTNEGCVALVSMGKAARLRHVRRGSEMTVAVRRGWNWVAVTGKADLIGPDDQAAGIDDEKLRLLLREIYEAAGGKHADFEEYDREMVRSRRAAVLVVPARIIGNLPNA